MRSIELDGSQTHFPTDDRGSSIATPRLKGKVRVFDGEKDPIKPFSTAFAESGSPIEPFLTAISKNGGSIGQFLEFEGLPADKGEATAFDVGIPKDFPPLYVNYRTPERGWGALVLTLHEKGYATWHLPEIRYNLSQRWTEFSFQVPHIAPDGLETRSLLGWLGRKLVSVIKFRLLEGTTDFLVGEILGRAESHFVKEGLLELDPQTGTSSPAEPGAGRRRLATSKRLKTLVLVHGTISSTQGAFKDLLAHASFRAVMNKYQSVLGFDHKTLSKSPGQNASELADALETYLGGAPCEMNLLSHSRGGLVARSLLENSAGRVPAQRLIMFGTPNDGTPLAKRDNIVGFLNTLQIILSLAGVSAGPVSAIFGAFKLLAHKIWRAPGLLAQSPHSRFLRQLNDPPDARGVDYVFCRADFQPDPYLRKLLYWAASQTLMDGRASDAIVPFDSVPKSSPNQALQALPDFRGGEVHHNNFFSQDQTRAHLGTLL